MVSAREMPQMYSSTRASTAYELPDAAMAKGGVGIAVGTAGNIAEPRRMTQPIWNAQPSPPPVKDTHMTANRIVQIYIADTYDSIPLDKRLIYEGKSFFTDLTDQELFFALDVNGILTAHNEYRVTVRDKKIKDRVEMLEPARVRDLKMVVVTVVTL